MKRAWLPVAAIGSAIFVAVCLNGWLVPRTTERPDTSDLSIERDEAFLEWIPLQSFTGGSPYHLIGGQVFAGDANIPGAHTSTFKVALYRGSQEATDWGKDSAHVYNYSPVGNAHVYIEAMVDADTFEVFDTSRQKSGFPYYRDKYRVFSCMRDIDDFCILVPVEGADPNTFELVDAPTSDAKDGNRYYLRAVAQ